VVLCFVEDSSVARGRRGAMEGEGESTTPPLASISDTKIGTFFFPLFSSFAVAESALLLCH